MLFELHKNPFVLLAPYITVHTRGSSSPPQLGSSTKLNCSVTFYPSSLINISNFTIQYQWSSNGTTRGNKSELLLPNLSPADVSTYYCNVTVTIQGNVISNESTYVLRAKRELYNINAMHIMYFTILSSSKSVS